MPAVTVNFGPLYSAFRQLAGFNLHSTGADGRPAWQGMAEEIADHQHRRALAEKDPRGNRWPELSPAYKAWKLRHGYSGKIGIKTGEMLSREQFLGSVDAGRYRLAVGYGQTAAARRKLGFFQRRRPVLGMDPELQARLRARLRADFRAHVRRAIRGQ